MLSQYIGQCTLVIAFSLLLYLNFGCDFIFGLSARPEFQDERGKTQLRSNNMAKKQMTKEELLSLLTEGQEQGFIKGNLPSDAEELQALVQTIHENLVDDVSYQASDNAEPGLQQLIIKRQPAGDWDDSTDRRLPLFLEGPEWTAIFRHTLKTVERDSVLPDEDIDTWSERQRERFKASLPAYPMLGRVWDTYIDVQYEPDEISPLRDECRRVKGITSNPLAVSGLDKIISACDQAIEIGGGILLLAD